MRCSSQAVFRQLLVGLVSLAAATSAAAGCEVRALRQSELTAERDAASGDLRSEQTGATGGRDSGVDAPGRDTTNGGDIAAPVPDLGVDAALEAGSEAAGEAGADAEPEPGDTGVGVDGGSPVDLGGPGDGVGDRADAMRACPSTLCEDHETCDVSTMRCLPRLGRAFISGSVTDGCTGRGLDARVGMAGRRQCSATNKGYYYFANLPEGTLALIAFKEGYKLYEIPVKVTSLGVVRNIVLQPDTAEGCAGPPVVEVACVCAIAGCP